MHDKINKIYFAEVLISFNGGKMWIVFNYVAKVLSYNETRLLVYKY